MDRFCDVLITQISLKLLSYLSCKYIKKLISLQYVAKTTSKLEGKHMICSTKYINKYYRLANIIVVNQIVTCLLLIIITDLLLDIYHPVNK